MFDLIKELTELPGPVGQEEVVLAHMEALWRCLLYTSPSPRD